MISNEPSEFEIEPLGSQHDRNSFSCGSAPLDLYLRQTARQHSERGISKTFVLVNAGASHPKQILGYYTLSICQVASGDLPEPMQKRLPRTAGAVRLGRLAVHRDFQGRGFGERLLVAALAKFQEIASRAGGIGVFVDAKDERAKLYYEKFGFIPVTADGLSLFLPAASITQLLGAE